MSSRRSDERGQSVVEFALIVPLMVIILFAIVDFARIYTTMMSVESAAREAADYGTTLGAGKWQVGAPMDGTVAEMERRACIASSNLTDYADADGDPQVGGCQNPTFAYALSETTGCENPLREPPCRVTVTLSYQFDLLAPLNIDFFGVQLGIPNSITFQRDSTFAMTDIDVAGP